VLHSTSYTVIPPSILETDLSASSWNCSDSGAEGSEDLITTLSEDSASTSASNVLLVLSRA
jgi:hypothetical protein